MATDLRACEQQAVSEGRAQRLTTSERLDSNGLRHNESDAGARRIAPIWWRKGRIGRLGIDHGVGMFAMLLDNCAISVGASAGEHVGNQSGKVIRFGL